MLTVESCALEGLDAQDRRPRLQAALTSPSLPLILGLAVTLSYTLFAFLASRSYPTAYSPMHNNTVSQLGNSNLNPHGAVFYLIGCALSGVAAMAFFASLGHWRSTGTLLQNRLLRGVQALGIIGGFGLIMNSVFPENQLPAHHFWAGVVFNSFAAAMLLSPVTFHRSTRLHLGVTAVPLLAVMAVVLMFVFAPIHWVEWLPVTVFLVSPILLGVQTRAVAAGPTKQYLAETL